MADVNINIQGLMYRTAGDKELITELCRLLRNEIPNYELELQLALNNDDYIKIATICHRMKSSVAVLGFDKLSAEILVIEEKAIKKSPDFEFSNKINCIFISLNKHLIELENFLKK
ncbi:MAG TPA: hypothetical protein PKN32_03100 [Bacteroidales bacterium]|nr:hypothetical protein [Bacteroidales bacterium]